ncbi:MAG TPA: hypothetical protein VJN94_17205 [Candidatus Binataceae bacterium]|nr:hypothetical protein [Candidatus Binataceae bacterium]
MNPQIGEAAARRHTAPIASVTVWALICGGAVILTHSLTASFGARAGSYRTGIVTLTLILLATLYPLRKYTVWFSLRWLRLATRLPRRLALRALLFDRLETWRTLHLTMGVFAMLPFWWHVESGRVSTLELVLKAAVILLVLSGFFGAMVEEFLPVRMLELGNKEVRLEDVEAGFHQLYVEAEEMVLGHSEALVQAYLASVRPIFSRNQPAHRMLWATLTGSDPSSASCRGARTLAAGFGAEAPVFDGLLDIAQRKVRLEHNQFNLRLGSRWLRVHRRLAMAVALLIIFHVTGVLYFDGL